MLVNLEIFRFPGAGKARSECMLKNRCLFSDLWLSTTPPKKFPVRQPSLTPEQFSLRRPSVQRQSPGARVIKGTLASSLKCWSNAFHINSIMCLPLYLKLILYMNIILYMLQLQRVLTFGRKVQLGLGTFEYIKRLNNFFRTHLTKKACMFITNLLRP